MNGPYSREFLLIGGPLGGTRQKIPLDHSATRGYIPPDTYRVGQIPALGSPGSSDAHFTVHTYHRCDDRYIYAHPAMFPDEDETADPVVMSFYERMEALVYIGAVVFGSALVAGAWFLVNGG
jgi:hypothetical protein